MTLQNKHNVKQKDKHIKITAKGRTDKGLKEFKYLRNIISGDAISYSKMKE